MSRTQHTNILPGRRLSLGFALTYVGLMVVIPLCAVAVMSASRGFDALWSVVTDHRTLGAYRISLLAALLAALINTVLGFVVAWVLARYTFRGRALLDALVDLPLALPTAVAGIALTAVYSQNATVGSALGAIGIRAAYNQAGIVLAMMLVSLPFAVRTVQPVIEDIDREIEEAAASLGSATGTTFRRVLLPPLVPAVLTGLALCFAKCLGEYGSVIFISSNIPGHTEIAPLLIMKHLEGFDEPAAASVAVGLLLLSLLLLLIINALQAWTRRRMSA